LTINRDEKKVRKKKGYEKRYKDREMKLGEKDI
jgi:hypothetical protein